MSCQKITNGESISSVFLGSSKKSDSNSEKALSSKKVSSSDNDVVGLTVVEVG